MAVVKARTSDIDYWQGCSEQKKKEKGIREC